MRLTASLIIACLFVSLSQGAQAQPETKPKREGVITGRLVADDGRPVAGARVMVVSTGGKLTDIQTIACDEAGNFKVAGLSPGAYTVGTQVPGYVVQTDSSGRRPIRIGEHATINLVKGGVITGRVTDEFGEPMAGVPVVTHKVRSLEGQAEFDYDSMNSLAATMTGGRETDDRGVYRIFGLEPGVYVVSLNGVSLSMTGIMPSRSEAPVYHPSSTRNAAAEVTVNSGSEASGIDIRYRKTRGRIISGAISGDSDGGSLFNGVVVTAISVAGKQPAAMVMLIGDRNFSLRGIEDGEYDLVAVKMGEGLDFSQSVPRRVTVKGADVSGVELKLVKLGSIEGRVVIEPSKPGDACKNNDDYSIEEITLAARRDEKTPSLLSAMGWFGTGKSASGAVPDNAGAFRLKNLEPGRIHVETDLPGENWYVRSITQKTSATPKPVDILPNGIAVKSGEKAPGVEVAIAEGAASLKGKVVPANEKANLPKQIRVHLVPAEIAAANDVRRYSEKIVGDDGSFEFKHIAPGKYLLHARQLAEKEAGVDRIRPAAWDASERSKLRREAEVAKNEVELQPCQRVKDHVLRFNR